MDSRAMAWGLGLAFLMISVSAPVAAQAPVDVDVPTWFVGDSWNYTENVRIELPGGDFAEITNGSYTWRVTDVTAFEGIEVYKLEKTGTFTGRARISGFSADLRNGRYSFGQNASVMYVRRSDLATVHERQFIRADVFVFIRLGWAELDVQLTQRPIIDTYDFPLNDGNVFTADTTLRGVGRLEYNITGLGHQRRDFDGSQLVPILSTAAWDDARQAFDVLAEAQDGSGSFIRDIYDPAANNYVQEVAQVPQADSQVNYTRTLTGLSLTAPAETIAFSIAGPAGDARAGIGDTVAVSGLVSPAPPAGTTVTIRQPETAGAQWMTMTDETGAFTLDVVVPDNFTDTTLTTFDLASVGLVASAGSAYSVATLVVIP